MSKRQAVHRVVSTLRKTDPPELLALAVGSQEAENKSERLRELLLLGLAAQRSGFRASWSIGDTAPVLVSLPGATPAVAAQVAATVPPSEQAPAPPPAPVQPSAPVVVPAAPAVQPAPPVPSAPAPTHAAPPPVAPGAIAGNHDAQLDDVLGHFGLDAGP